MEFPRVWTGGETKEIIGKKWTSIFQQTKQKIYMCHKSQKKVDIIYNSKFLAPTSSLLNIMQFYVKKFGNNSKGKLWVDFII